MIESYLNESISNENDHFMAQSFEMSQNRFEKID